MTRNLTLLAAVLLLVWGCANIRAPQGGAKDVDPPVVLEAIPAVGTTQFAGKSFSMTFNEWIQLSDIRAQLVVSPPLNKQPAVTLKKRTVTVSWEEPLRENTTYTFFFGDGIRDFTEANPAVDLSYVLATGPVLDSLELSGVVRSAATGEPVGAGYRVLAYASGRKKPAMEDLPDYFARTGSDGTFRLRNMRAGTYDLVALQDLNGNYLVDEFEEVAFTHTGIEVQGDSLQDPATLYAFAQPGFEQRIRDYRTDSSGYFALLPAQRSTDWQFRDLSDPDRNLLWYPLDDADSVHVWMMGTPPDARLPIEISSEGQVIDTLDMRFFKRDVRGMQAKWVPRKIADAHEPVSLRGGEFITALESTLFSCVIDSTEQGMVVKRNPDDPRQLQLFPGLKPGQACTLTALPGAFSNGEGWTLKDTLVVDLTARKIEDYTQLSLKLNGFEDHSGKLFELLDNNGKPILTWTSAENSVLEANRLVPGTYRVRWTEDRNGNGRWDPGDYTTGLQPERVQYFPETIQARANWVMEVEWVRQP